MAVESHAPPAEVTIPAITAGTAASIRMSLFLMCPQSAAAEVGMKYMRFIPAATVRTRLRSAVMLLRSIHKEDE